MLRSLYTGASGLTAQQFNIDTIANNLANVNTTGYKKVRPEFQDLFYLSLKAPVQQENQGSAVPRALYVGLGARPSGSQTIMSQGNLQKTENPLDVALFGHGFFTVSQDWEGNNRFYTRDGSFKQNANGDIVTADGYYVLSDSGNAINIPTGAKEVAIARDGMIMYTNPGDENAQEAGKLGVVQFSNPGGLERADNPYRCRGIWQPTSEHS